ncbi:MAG: hypothetical protein IT317_13395 [Anaerolineales bacterium]|nr:hypothetical protein [Anaerolineales bacterium]
MYPLDAHLAAALDRQADHVRAVEAASTYSPVQSARRLSAPARAGIALAVAAPVMLLMAWGLLVR